MSLFKGVDHVGVGVADMEEAKAFYGRVGFSDVRFDYTGRVPGPDREARVVMLSNPGATPVGAGGIKLVQVLDGDGAPPAPTGGGWGELGICEICLHARGVTDVHRSLVAAGAESLMEPLTAAVDPNDVSLDIAYVADPWGGKLELIEWTGLWHSLPGPARAEGVNHVAFGVADMARTRAFYEGLGFTEHAVRVGRLLRADGAVVSLRAARPAHAHDAVVAGCRHRAGRAGSRGAGLPG